MKPVLSELEKEVVELFVRVAGILSLPRSVGELYGILYISPDPLCMEELIRKLGISKGSTSQGLKILRSFGAVRTVYVAGDRRDHFTAEAELRKIAAGFVNEQLRPQLESGRARMERLDALVETEAPDRREFSAERIDRLKSWHRRAGLVLPFALNFIKKD